MKCWDDLFHIDKLKMMCTFYKLLEFFFPLPYDFGMCISLAYKVCAPRIFPIMAGIHNKSKTIDKI